jgi:superfamily II DNA or RNA helicase
MPSGQNHAQPKDGTSSHFQSKILRHKTTSQEHRIYRAGLEWDLTDPIVIESRDDIKSEYRWRDRLEPYHHQVTNLMTFCRRLPVTLLADDVGLGKTISAGLIMSELISRSRLSKILIVCPKLLGPQWQEELLTKFNIPSKIAIGRDLIKADLEETGAVITTYNSARLHLDSISQDRFQMLVLDEAHKLRNLYGVESPPQVAKRFRKALEERRFRFVLMLTATPIQNRLWDLYSLVDLLTVARGHQNPFGSEGMFARKFIADDREQARQLKAESRDEFRSIVYGYMSRVRRGDAKLSFPDRVVQMHKVEPTMAERMLIAAIAQPIQKLNKLAQISILQALTSSPDALMAQLNNMAKNGTVPNELAATVRSIVSTMPTSAKLDGLAVLIDRLKRENPNRWRLVIFTGRLETQTSIQNFLEKCGLKVGIINGASGLRNQETIGRFRKNPPDCHVIVSTEAGSEGLNLQVANVLVNYDLPWNPMILEQRIGRVQRLASEHASVGIFNIMLRGTFEEYIVGRLMEKLQMASHAIGDIEALLEASGISGEDENGATSFDERIRELVIAALSGKDVEAATRQAEQSIADAKRALEREEESINSMLGGMDGAEYVGPRAPKLPEVERSMGLGEFTLAAFESLGARITQQTPEVYLVEEHGAREHIRFEEQVPSDKWTAFYAPGTPAFLRLVDRTIATGVHDVEDVDRNAAKESEELARQWITDFGGTFRSSEVDQVTLCYEGHALVRVRATVAHDSYERLVNILCSPEDHFALAGPSGLGALPHTIANPSTLGIDTAVLAESAKLDEAISEFCRFYLERREQEMLAAGEDNRKSKKLEDEFTPRLQMTLVALDGKLHRQLKMRARYSFDLESEYQSVLTVVPHSGRLVELPKMGSCARSGKTVPLACLKKCQITGILVLQHLLVCSEMSSRFALPECTVLCVLSGKRILTDEAQTSAVSGHLVASSLLKTSALSGKRAEPSYFGQCEFTMAEVLDTELTTSEFSGKRYRIDEQCRSAVSGKAGHKQEFLICHETRESLARAEAEQCELTGKYVRPGVLEPCAITQKRVLPAELARCTATKKRVLKKLLVMSSLTGVRILEDVAVRSTTGEYCAPAEANQCLWSGQDFHPDDLDQCELTGLTVHSKFATGGSEPRLRALVELLDGIKRTTDAPQPWDELATKIAPALGKGRCRIEAAVLSPNKQHLAICCEVRTLLGLRVHHVGLVYSMTDHSIVGRVASGRRGSKEWSRFER